MGDILFIGTCVNSVCTLVNIFFLSIFYYTSVLRGQWIFQTDLVYE